MVVHFTNVTRFAGIALFTRIVALLIDASLLIWTFAVRSATDDWKSKKNVKS